MIISIASGKGGTGKTLVATSLALALKGRDKVQILDCDVEEPNAHVFLKPAFTHNEIVSIPVPKVDEEKCTYCGKCAEVCVYNAIAVIKQKVLVFPELCHGCGACSYLCPEKAISEEAKEIGVIEMGYADGLEFTHGRLSIGQLMAPPIIRQVKEHASYEGVVIVDVPPGTSCPVVEAVKDSDFNRAGVGDGKTEEYCQKENIPILFTIPLDTKIAHLYSEGITLVEGMPQWQKGFLELFDKVRKIVNERGNNPKR